LDSPPNDTKYRCHWTPPLAIDPFDHNTVYYGCQVIFKTSNGGRSWSVASPDLSTHDPSRIVSSGGLEGDNLGQFYGEVVFAIAPSQIQKGLIWAGTNDGQVWYTKDGGGNWTNVTKNIAGLPAWGTITSIQPSHFDAGTAYISVDFHLMDNRDPFIYKTTDFGQSWTKISDGLPKGELAYVRVIAEDPNCKGLLFAGTGNALQYSLDDGGHWTMFGKGLPHSTVSWAVVQKQFHDLVVSTYGRGLYILDDITPLEQMAKNNAGEPVRLFEPRAAYRFVRGGSAPITYSLKTAVKANDKDKDADTGGANDTGQAAGTSRDRDNGPVQIEILDANGKLVRKLKAAPGKAGTNRVEWDLHYDAPHLVALRTAAPDNSHIWEESRFRGKDSRPITHWGLDPAEVGPIAAPGKYTVKLTVNGKSFTEPLTILRDPNVSTSDAEIEASVKTLLRIRDDITTTSDMVNQIEWMRRQLGDVESMLKDEKTKGELLKSVKAMDEKLQGVEFKLIARVEANSDDKYFVSAYKVYLNLLWLNGEVGSGAGDVAGGAAFAPTDTALSLLQMIEKNLNVAKGEYQNLISRDIPAFNRSLAEHGVIPVTTVGPAAEAGGLN
ncbi:MAG: sialidase, partial [Candidatus Acidiferrales bacterium]